MCKVAVLALAGALAALPSAARAQATDPNTTDSNPICVLTQSIFVGITPLKCVGFFGQNSNQYGTGASIVNSGNTVDPFKALSLMGFNMANSHSVVEKVDSWNGTANFATQMTGLTVIGFHWGNYPNSEAGNVSAFYEFDFGAVGTKNLDLINTAGISNAAIIYTYTGGGNVSTNSVVPEPSTYAMTIAGLAAVLFATRRKRTVA